MLNLLIMTIIDILAVAMGLGIFYFLGEFNGYNKGFKDCERKLIRRK